MKPVMMQVNHDPENGEYGDCHRACVASILELEPNEVDHFCDSGPNVNDFSERIDKWHKDRGILYVRMAFYENPLEFMEMNNPGIYYIFAGNSPAQVLHSVVALGNKIVHDPADRSEGKQIIGPDKETDCYYIDIIGHRLAYKDIADANRS